MLPCKHFNVGSVFGFPPAQEQDHEQTSETHADVDSESTVRRHDDTQGSPFTFSLSDGSFNECRWTAYQVVGTGLQRESRQTQPQPSWSPPQTATTNTIITNCDKDAEREQNGGRLISELASRDVVLRRCCLSRVPKETKTSATRTTVRSLATDNVGKHEQGSAQEACARSGS